MQGVPTQSEINMYITSEAFQEAGFQVATECIIPQVLKRIRPKGGKHFRDAMIEACMMMTKVSELLTQTGSEENWNVVQVVLTDGDDGGSNTEILDVIKKMSIMRKELKVKMVKTILIGIGVSEAVEQELKNLASAGLDSVQYMGVNESQLKGTIEKISVKIGLQNRKQAIAMHKKNQTHQPKPAFIENYALLLNLQASDWTNGERWKQVCEGIDKCMGYFGNNDLIGAIVFNHEVKVVTKLNPEDQCFVSMIEVKEVNEQSKEGGEKKKKEKKILTSFGEKGENGKEKTASREVKGCQPCALI